MKGNVIIPTRQFFDAPNRYRRVCVVGRVGRASGEPTPERLGRLVPAACALGPFRGPRVFLAKSCDRLTNVLHEQINIALGAIRAMRKHHVFFLGNSRK